MTYQKRLHLERQARELAHLQDIEKERNTIVVGLGAGVVGLSVRDNSLRVVQQTLDIAKIDQLVRDLLMARKHLEFAQAIDDLVVTSPILG